MFCCFSSLAVPSFGNTGIRFYLAALLFKTFVSDSLWGFGNSEVLIGMCSGQILPIKIQGY